MPINNIHISAAIITLNEEKNIGACLKSLDWVDDIVVIAKMTVITRIIQRGNMEFVRVCLRRVIMARVTISPETLDVKMTACQMTVDLFDMDSSEFIDGIEFGGAATFFEFAGETDICLYI